MASEDSFPHRKYFEFPGLHEIEAVGILLDLGSIHFSLTASAYFEER